MVAIVDRNDKRRKLLAQADQLEAELTERIPVTGQIIKDHRDLTLPPISTARRMRDPEGMRRYKENYDRIDWSKK
jgi:hypothetical protein